MKKKQYLCRKITEEAEKPMKSRQEMNYKKKMKVIKYLFISVLAVIFTGCAGLNMTPYANDPVETKVILSESNYHIVKEVSGEWSAIYVFGIGGLSKKALENNAVSEMYKNAGLTGNQQIINITTTQSVETWALVYSKVRAIAHGYVIEFEE